MAVPDFRATGVRDDQRAYEWPAIIRAVNTVDAMTADEVEIDWAVLKKITARILAEVPGICRVCYDLTPKPTGTIEWEQAIGLPLSFHFCLPSAATCCHVREKRATARQKASKSNSKRPRFRLESGAFFAFRPAKTGGLIP